MAFIMASKCDSVRRVSMMDNWPFAVSLTVPKVGKPEMKISFSAEFAASLRMMIGDGVDIGIDSESMSICVQAVSKDQSAPCSLHSRSDSKTARIGCGCCIRDEWRMSNVQSIPSCPVTHVQSHPGRVFARLPDSWKRFFGGKFQ